MCSAVRPHKRSDKKPKGFFARLGPGFITGASDDDPSGIATYAQTGAQFGYTQLWMALWTLPFMIAVQEMCGRIGLVTGKGIAGVMRQHAPRWLLYGTVFLLLIANTINIGADLGAMAAAAQLVTGISFPALIIAMTLITLILEVFVSYKLYASFLKYLALTLFAYVIVAFLVNIDWQTAFAHLLIPRPPLTKESLVNILAVFGTTISPYLFFWQAGEEVEEEVCEGKLQTMGMGRPKITKDDICTMQHDTEIGMTFSNVITFFIVASAAATLFPAGVHQIDSAVQAAEILRPLAGPATSYLFALGIIGTGLLAVPVLAGSASYALSETFQWKEGLYRKFQDAHGFYGVITLATLAGLLVNFIGVPPFRMLYYAAVVNGIIAPPLILVIVWISSQKKIMGKHCNHGKPKYLAVMTAVIMAGAGIAALVL